MEDIVSIDVGEVIRARGAGFTEREASTLGSLSLAELLRTKGIFWFRSQRGLYASELIRKLIDEWLTASDEAFLATLALDLTTLVGRGLPDKIGDLRAQVRRLIQRGRTLMSGGYCRLLQVGYAKQGR